MDVAISEPLQRRQIEVLQIAEGHFGSQVLFAANDLGIFDLLAKDARSGEDLAHALGAPIEPLQRLLNAAVAIRLLTYNDGRYANSELASTALVSGGAGYLGNWLRLLSRWSHAWVRLKDCVLTGEPAEDPHRYLGGDPAYTRDFITAMDDYARLRGREVVDHLDVGGRRRLIDIGGGPGTYAFLFARRWPDLDVTLFDLPEVAEIARNNALAAGLADRVSVMPGNYHADDLGEGYDVAFISDVLHQESPESGVMILAKAYRALTPGGQVVVQGVFLNDDRVSPRWPAMQALILLLVRGSGRVYTVRETMDMMTAAGFRNCVHHRMSLLNVHSLIIGQKV